MNISLPYALRCADSSSVIVLRVRLQSALRCLSRLCWLRAQLPSALISLQTPTGGRCNCFSLQMISIFLLAVSVSPVLEFVWIAVFRVFN